MSSCPRRATLTTFVLSCCSLLFACGGGSPATVPSPELPPELDARIRAIYETNEMQAESPLSQLWLPDGSGLLVLEPTSDGAQELVRYDAASGAREVIRSSSQLVPLAHPGPSSSKISALAEWRRLLLQEHARTAGRRPGQRLLVARSGVYRIADGPVRVASCRVGDALSPDGQRVLYIHGHNLYVHDVSSGRNIRLTHDGMPGSLGNGVSDWGGRGGEVRWSPDGEQIAYIQGGLARGRDVPAHQLYGEPVSGCRVFALSEGGNSDPETAPGWWSADAARPVGWLFQASQETSTSEVSIGRGARRSSSWSSYPARAIGAMCCSPTFEPAGSVAPTKKPTRLGWTAATGRTAASTGWGDGQAFVLVSEKDGWRHAYLISRDGRKETLLTRGAHDIVTRRPREILGGFRSDRRGARLALLPCVTRRRRPEVSLSRAPGCH